MKERKTIKTDPDALGGSDFENWSEYSQIDESAYFDKRNHLERSIQHQPNHLKSKRYKKLLKKISEVSF